MNDDKWKRFVQTGSVYDYLEYTACALEGEHESDGKDYGNGSGAVDAADGRVRQKTDDSDKGAR